MTEINIPIYEQSYTVQERTLAEHIINLEKSALDKFFNGDMSGYRNLWSERSFTYFDALTTERIESLGELKSFLDNLEGKLHADDYEFRSPRVQFGQKIAVLTYQLFAHTNVNDIQYNVVEIFQKENADEWRVIHSTWSFIRPMDLNFSSFKSVVV